MIESDRVAKKKNIYIYIYICIDIYIYIPIYLSIYLSIYGIRAFQAD